MRQVFEPEAGAAPRTAVREPGGGPRETLGIVDPVGARAGFALDRRAPSPDLACIVDWFWVSRWELGEREFVQPVIAHPVVNVVVERGRFAAHGFVLATDERSLTGSGVAVAAKLRAGAFAVLTGRTLAPAVRGPRAGPRHSPAVLDAAEFLGPDAVAVGTEAFDAGMAGRVDDAVGALAVTLADLVARRRADPAAAGAWRDLALVDAAVRSMDELGPGEPVGALARTLAVSPRSLQRAFARSVGVGPKWVLSRRRVQLAAELVALDPGVDLAGLAERVGYYDQAHFGRDFAAATGSTPAAYARRCARSRGVNAGRAAASADTASP
jgi:AraC-like DNA-binding protein